MSLVSLLFHVMLGYREYGSLGLLHYKELESNNIWLIIIIFNTLTFQTSTFQDKQ